MKSASPRPNPGFSDVQRDFLKLLGPAQHLFKMPNLRLRTGISFIFIVTVAIFASAGCNQAASQQSAGGGPQAMPVQTKTISLSPVPRQDEYVATVKSRRSANIQPQVDGTITKILVKSGDRVKAGQPLMSIDPLKQEAVVDQQRSTEAQKKATLDYDTIDLERQKKLYEEGVASKQVYDLAVQAYNNAKADYEASSAATVSEQRQLAYYGLTAPFDGIVGDIPVHVGDYVAPTTLLTTVDENAELEAYIYIPTERASDIHMGLPVQIVNSNGDLLDSSKIDFISQQVDNATQGILVKAPIHAPIDKFRNAQLVKARVIWSTAPTPTVPVLAVTRIGGQTFVYVVAPGDKGGDVAKQHAVTLGDTVGNDYAVTNGLKAGDQVIISGIQLLIDGAPVKPIS
jgi:RND family efflux transporter MFP subunit